MIARIRTSMKDRDEGFTLVELLVVMIIIGILAAIAIPVFLNQQKKARDTAAKSDVAVIGKAVTAYYVDGTKVLYLSEAAGKWILSENSNGSSPVDTGNLSSSTTVIPVTAVTGITGETAFCVSVKTSDQASDDTTGLHTWKYTQDGLKNGTC